MCGILFNISSDSNYQFNEQSLSDLSRRGPDTLHTVGRKITTSDKRTTWYLNFAASVLWLRGAQPHLQPLVDEATDSVLCWNGEAWSFDDKPVPGNDSAYIFRELLAATTTSSSEFAASKVVDVLDRIKGPYAFVFFDGRSKQVFYGRDVLGRRSLLASSSNSTNNVLTVSSLTASKNVLQQVEIDTTHIHVVDLTQSDLFVRALPRKRLIADIDTTVPRPDEQIPPCPSTTAVDSILAKLSAAIQRRVEAIPSYNLPAHTVTLSNPSKVAILFSGGLDCTLLARLTHDILPTSEPIDLLNVAFENPRVARARARTRTTKNRHSPRPATNPESYSDLEPEAENLYELCPDRMTGRSSYAELIRVCPTRLWRFVAINIPYLEYKLHSPTITALMAPHNTEMDHSITAALYFGARGRGQATLPTDPADSSQHETESKSETAIQTQVQPQNQSPDHASDHPPSQQREQTPKPNSNPDQSEYTTPARVLLSGLGADELFAGYTRHTTSFTRLSWPGLLSELALDISRIATRNLGRDDRVISHWARETRYPFLDEEFVNHVLKLPVWEKCGYRVEKAVKRHFEGAERESNCKSNGDGDGDIGKMENVENEEELDPAKMALRIGLWRSGMRRAAQERKRAIQFGTRSAKMEVGKTRGTDPVG